MVLSFVEDALAHLFSDRKVQIQPYKEKTICRVIIIFYLALTLDECAED